ncbi:MAG: U32 family peptidase, partial [Solobacterium sp.]|nr:U32 family peptidase [Solobacterium sp.]
MKKIELLSPAGNPESLKAAVQGGCDAVYLGVTNFGARAFAGNFNHEELLEAVTYCHTRGVKVYVTMNTLLFEEEIDNAMKEVEFLYEADVDALLIQDFGLFHRVRIEFPDFEVHCSTQMHIHNPAGCRFMKEMGASRAVVARETPIEVIRECVKTGIEIEVFAYGALCVSYSGQCLMSESVKHRSGNRGVCAQMCRLRFYESDGNVRLNTGKGEYALAMKDLSLIDEIPELIEAGAVSLKIEGRMKRREYVYLVTKTFREAIDAYYRNEEYHVSAERLHELESLFHRGFTKGHAFHDDEAHRMTSFRPNHMGVEIGKVVRFHNGKVTVKLSESLSQHDGLRILNRPADTGLTAVRIEKNGKLVNHAEAGDTVILDCKSKPAPKPGQPLLKTSDTELMGRLDQ